MGEGFGVWDLDKWGRLSQTGAGREQPGGLRAEIDRFGDMLLLPFCGLDAVINWVSPSTFYLY